MADVEAIYKEMVESGRTSHIIRDDAEYLLEHLQIGDPNIDQLLGSTLCLPRATLLYGAAGTGKTLFSIQAAICSLKKRPFSYRVAFFTTDGPFPSKRLFQLQATRNNPSLLDRFFIFEIRSSSELISFLKYFLPVWCADELLIIVDNITSLIRFSVDLHEISVDLPKAIHFARTRMRCTFIFVSQIKAIVDGTSSLESSAPAIHPSLISNGHLFDQKIELILEPSCAQREKNKRILFHPTLGSVACPSSGSLPSISYVIDEQTGFTSIS